MDLAVIEDRTKTILDLNRIIEMIPIPMHTHNIMMDAHTKEEIYEILQNVFFGIMALRTKLGDRTDG